MRRVVEGGECGTHSAAPGDERIGKTRLDGVGVSAFRIHYGPGLLRFQWNGNPNPKSEFRNPKEI